MPINTDLNQSPYFDDFNIEDQYYRVLFKPGFALQARELTQLQTILQNQVEQFGDNIFKEGSIVKGCNFTNLDGLEFVKLSQSIGNPLSYISTTAVENVGGIDVELDYVYVLSNASGLRASIVQAAQGFESRPPNLNTFFVNYLNSVPGQTQFARGESLTITLFKYKRGTTTQAFTPTIVTPASGVAVTSLTTTPHVGKAFGIQAAPGVIFQKGHFIFANDQKLVVSKYSDSPDGVSVGYKVVESRVNALQDSSLYDNANGSSNENAPGADRLKLTPTLTVLDTSTADVDSDFFTLIRYQNGNAITLRDVSQYNVLGEELARRTYEESGNYILKDFSLSTDDRVPAGAANNEVHVLVGTGTAYIKGYRVENSGERSFAIDQITTTEIAENQAVSFEYGSSVSIVEINGKVDIDYTSVNLQDAGSSNIGTAIVTNITPEKVYLRAVRLNSGKKPSDIVKLTDGSGDIVVANSTVTATFNDTGKAPLIFDTGMISLFETSDTLIPVRVQETATPTTNQIVITADPGEDFVCNNDDILVVETTGTYVPVTSVSTSLNSSVLTVNLDGGVASGADVTIYYNKRLIGSSGGIDPYNKTVVEPYVKVNYSSAQTKYNLGFPDVFQIQSVVDSAGKDFTGSFRLNSNQKDAYYDLSYMEYISGREEPSGLLTVKLKVFQISAGTGDYFFTINSYPNTLDRYDIPVYVSSTGARYNLRECFDFRPYVNIDSNVDYTDLTEGSAGTVTALVDATAPVFSSAPLIPAVNQTATTDIEYYLSRVDTIVCDSYGEISILKGKEERFAIPPRVNTDQLAIAEVFIPGYPALSVKRANTERKSEYAIRAKATGIKNYTMKDLHSLEKKIDNMAYYISLNQLESETQNLTVLDENGLNRFKNGFIVDPFNDLSLANIENAQFNAAVPFNQRILTPSVKTFPLDLRYKSSTNASIFPSTTNAKIGTLGRNANVVAISQPYASGFRNCVSNFYRYIGDGAISPPYDATYDTTVNPVTIDIDLSAPFNDFIDNIQEFIPLTDTTVTEELIDGFGGAGPTPWQRRFGNFPGAGGTFLETTSTRNFVVNGETTVQNFVGDFVSNFQFQPFMAARDISIYMSGLRPDTRHYFFFDGVDVNSNVAPGTAVDDADSVQRFGELGAAVSTDSNGVLRAVFAIPAETFFVGDRVLEIVDVDSYGDIDAAAISKGFVTYRAYNFSVEKTALTTSTRSPDFDIATTTTTRNVVRRPVGRDPIAQTFFVKKGMGAGSNSIFVSEVDVFFKRKSDTNGITLQIREVVNGYPSNQNVPLSTVHKLPGAVNVSDDASTATTFAFTAPIRLDVEKEYAIVLQPDASDPNYLVYISKVGGTDLTPGATQGAAIVQDWGDGVLFSSTNNSAWKSYQDEDMKFVLRRHVFNQSTGTVTLTNNDHEFLTVNDITGRFNPGELIYQVAALQGVTQPGVNMGLNSATITGTDLDDTYVVGDYILVTAAGPSPRYDIFKVISVDSGTQLTLDKPASFTVSAGTAYPVVVGYLSYYNVRNPFEMHLERSSAKAGRTLSTGSDIVGFDSGSTANTASIDNINLSYVQPMITRANDSVSSTLVSGTFVPPADTNSTYTTALKFNDNNHFNKGGVVVYSKSNDPNKAKAFDFVIDLANSGNSTSSPIVDVEVSKLIAYQYKITNTPASTSKYISKTIELAANLDAEDIHVILTAYKPNGTDVKVYIRPQNAFDSDNFESIDWIELELFEGVGVYSSTSNINDYREFKYRVASSDKDVDGALTYTSNAGDFSGFRRFAIRIDMLSPNVYNAPTLRDYRAIALT